MMRIIAPGAVGRPAATHAFQTRSALMVLFSTDVLGESAAMSATTRGVSTPKILPSARALFRYHPRLTRPEKATAAISWGEGRLSYAATKFRAVVSVRIACSSGERNGRTLFKPLTLALSSLTCFLSALVSL